MRDENQAKVVKAEYTTRFRFITVSNDDGPPLLLYDAAQKAIDSAIVIRTWFWKDDAAQKAANDFNDSLHVTLTLDFAGTTFEREIKIKPIRSGDRKIVKIEGVDPQSEDYTSRNSPHVTFELSPSEWQVPLLEAINKVESRFCLSENELLLASAKLLEGTYSYVHFLRHTEISGCIIDGLAWVNSERKYDAKIIGFEAKSNRDNYNRLYGQINSYLAVCDEVYLVVQDKKPPRDLPFYVGIISVQQGKTEIVRPATSLRHDIDAGNFWKNLLRNLSTHCGLEQQSAEKMAQFFDAVETIKRKLLWNQFVEGWHKTWVKSYVPLTETEKRIVKAYFNLKEPEPEAETETEKKWKIPGFEEFK